MPSSVRVGSRPLSNSLIFSNSSGVRPCSRIISGVMAMGLIAELVIGESSLSHLAELFACGIVTTFLKKKAPRVERTLLSAAVDLDRVEFTTSDQLESKSPPRSKAAGEGARPTLPVYTVADEVSHRRHRRTY